MRILGIDQSFTSTGIALLENNKCTLKIINSNKSDDKFDRANTIAKGIKSVIEDCLPDLAGVEGLPYGGIGNVTRDLAGLQFVIVVALRELGLKVKVVAPKSVKKFAVSGVATKIELYEALPYNIKCDIDENGWKVTTGRYDVTDAYWIAKYLFEKS